MSFSKEEIDEFKAEALDLLDTAERSLLALDEGAEFEPMFDAIFRSFHNLKGASGMMELSSLQSHMHELENILIKYKETNLIPKETIGFLLQGVDGAKSILNGQAVSLKAIPSPTIGNENSSTTDAADTIDLETEVESSHKNPIDNDLSLVEFINECEEIVERVTKNLQALENESSPPSKEAVDALYRDIHSLKGSAYLFSFKSLGDLGHAMESSLERLRAGTHKPISQLFDVLFKSIVVIERILIDIKQRSSDQRFTPVVNKFAFALEAVARRLPALATAAPANAEETSLATVTKSRPLLTEHVTPQTTQTPPLSRTPLAADSSEGASSIRVSVNLLDSLMNLMGEMVLVRNQMLQYSNSSKDREFLSMSKRLNAVTSEIQSEMMKTRMQPIGNILGKFNRVVRDLSHELNKKISLSIFGAETEIDKSLLEALKDPLTHIVRNSCDHGIESSEKRLESGKNKTGSIVIKAYHEGGQVIVEVHDDGKGLSAPILAAKAVEKGILSAAESSTISEKQALNLIFAPGFSTAAQVTNVSGRGVGMDVVRTNIERIGGTIDLESVAGTSTTIKIKIPLTLAIIPALIVNCNGGTFAIPQLKLEELVRVDPTSSQNRVEFLHGAPVLRLRGNILSLVDLIEVLKIKNESKYEDRVLNVAVLATDQGSFGLIVDQIQDTADIVVKPLNRLLKSLQAYAGATILGDGSVALILDVNGIAKLAHIGQEKVIQAATKEEKSKYIKEEKNYLTVKVSSPTKHVFVLEYVYRLEEFKKKNIEYLGTQQIIRYGNIILPIISLNAALEYKARDNENDIVSVVVIQHGDYFYGLEVNEILSIFSSSEEIDSSHVCNSMVSGHLNLTDEFIVVLDPFQIIDAYFPNEIADDHLRSSLSKGERTESTSKERRGA